MLDAILKDPLSAQIIERHRSRRTTRSEQEFYQNLLNHIRFDRWETPDLSNEDNLDGRVELVASLIGGSFNYQGEEASEHYLRSEISFPDGTKVFVADFCMSPFYIGFLSAFGFDSFFKTADEQIALTSVPDWLSRELGEAVSAVYIAGARAARRRIMNQNYKFTPKKSPIYDILEAGISTTKEMVAMALGKPRERNPYDDLWLKQTPSQPNHV